MNSTKLGKGLKCLGHILVLVGIYQSAVMGQSQGVAEVQSQAAQAGQTTDSTKQTQQSGTVPSTTDKTTKQTQKPKKNKRGQLVVAPIPVSHPTVGSGLVLIAAYVFKLNENDNISPPSVIGLAAAFTNNGSKGGGIAGRLYFDENKYQTTFAVAKGGINYDFYGIGRIPGKAAISIPIHQEGKAFFGEFLRNVGKNIFVGPRYQHRSFDLSLDGEQTPGGFVIPANDFKTRTQSLGAHIQRDLRDNSFYPTKGSLFDAIGDYFFYPKDTLFNSIENAAGNPRGRRTYQTYKLSYNGYQQIAPKQIIAYRGMTCTANGNVPFYDLCFFGTENDLRGYTGGEFQNRRMFATQAEYRLELRKRLGLVAFGGVGGVARTWGDFRSDALLPAAGAGLRFTLDKKNHINYRIDWAIGRAGHTLTIGVGEAF